MIGGTEPWRGLSRDGGGQVREAVATARGLRVCCKRRDGAVRDHRDAQAALPRFFL